MIKKILIHLSIFASFIFCFLFGNYINTLAMGNFDNSIGTIPVQMDIDNYNRQNIFDGGLQVGAWIFADGNYTFTNEYRCNTSYISVVPDSTITLSLNGNYNVIGSGFVFFNNGVYVGFSSDSFTATVPSNANQVLFNIFIGNNEFNLTDIQLEYGSNATEYAPYFEFGYNVSLYYLINATSSATVNYYFNDNTYIRTVSSVESGYLIENYYLPFFIDDKGYISLPNINFGISSIINDSTRNTYSLQLELIPVFNAYYKGEYTTNIYTKLNYMSNDLFFSGISFSGCNSNTCVNNLNAGNLSLTSPKTLAVTEQNNTGNLSTTNISTYYNDDVKNRNYFEYNNYLNVGFRMGDLAEDFSFMNGRNYTFGISSLSSRIVDNQTTTTPLPNNPDTYDKYNTCSAWYDIPCQLGNAVTYVIYETPIISPILTFIVSFITMFSNLVTFVDLFSSFGIVFGCFVLYMFINLLHKYSK